MSYKRVNKVKVPSRKPTKKTRENIKAKVKPKTFSQAEASIMLKKFRDAKFPHVDYNTLQQTNKFIMFLARWGTPKAQKTDTILVYNTGRVIGVYHDTNSGFSERRQIGWIRDLDYSDAQMRKILTRERRKYIGS